MRADRPVHLGLHVAVQRVTAFGARVLPDGALVVNVGRPGDDAWFERLPRLDYDDMVREV